MEARIAELDTPLPDRAAAARRRLYQRFADQIRARFRDRLSSEETAPLREAVGWLKSRDAVLAAAVGAELSVRLTAWQPVLELTAPFDGWQRAFITANEKVRPSADRQALERSFGPRGDYYVFSQDTYPGSLKVEVVLTPSWERSVQLGFSLNPERGHGYVFLVSVMESFARIGEFPLEPQRATFADAAWQLSVPTLRPRRPRCSYWQASTPRSCLPSSRRTARCGWR